MTAKTKKPRTPTAKEVFHYLKPEDQFNYLVEEERRTKREELIGDIFTFAVVAGCALIISIPSLNEKCESALHTLRERLVATIFQLPSQQPAPTQTIQSPTLTISNRKAYPGDKIGKYTVGSDFKPCVKGGKIDCRWHPIYGGWSAHKGLDIGSDIGRPLLAIGEPNSVTKVECLTQRNKKGELIGAGNYAVLTNPQIFNTRFLAMHLSACNPGLKKPGEVFGKIGNTGASTDPHLHWQQEYKNIAIRPDFDWLHQTLTGQLPAASVTNTGLPLKKTSKYGHFAYSEASRSDLVNVGHGQRLHRDAAAAFNQMAIAARKEGIVLVPLSGFRDKATQHQLFYGVAAERGQTLKQRAFLSAPPGYSEHHTGYAVDIGDGNVPATNVNPKFENTQAFKWLNANAARYSFKISFPPNNAQGVSYEPWHWRFVGSPQREGEGEGKKEKIINSLKQVVTGILLMENLEIGSINSIGQVGGSIFPSSFPFFFSSFPSPSPSSFPFFK